MTGEGKEKDSKDGSYSVSSSSKATKFSENNAEEIRLQDNGTQVQKEASKGTVEEQENEVIDEIKSTASETTGLISEMDENEDFDVKKDDDGATSVTSKVIRSKVEMNKEVTQVFENNAEEFPQQDNATQAQKEATKNIADDQKNEVIDEIKTAASEATDLIAEKSQSVDFNVKNDFDEVTSVTPKEISSKVEMNKVTQVRENNVEEIPQQANATQAQKEATKDIKEEQKNEVIDEMKSAASETTDLIEEMDKNEDLSVKKGDDGATGVITKALRSKEEMNKGVTKVRRKVENATNNTPMVTRSAKKEKKDIDFNKGKVIEKTTKDDKSAGTSRGITNPNKKFFEYKTKLTSKDTNKVQLSKSPANTDLKSLRAKAATGIHALKPPANSESNLLHTKSNTRSTVSKSPANAELKSLRAKTTTGVHALKSPANSESNLQRTKPSTGLPVSNSSANAESKQPRSIVITGSTVSKSPANADSKSQRSKVNNELQVLKSPASVDSRRKNVDKRNPSPSEVCATPIKAREFWLPKVRAHELNLDEKKTSKTSKMVPDLKLKDTNKNNQLCCSNETKLKPSLISPKPLLEDPGLKTIDEQKQPFQWVVTEPDIEGKAFESSSQVNKQENSDELIQLFNSNETDFNPEVCSSKSLFDDNVSKDIDQQKPFESILTEPSTELNACKLLSQDLIQQNTEDQNQLLESVVTERNIAANSTTPSLQDSTILAIDENFRKLDLNTSRVEQDESLVNQDKANVCQDMENEKIINLSGDANLSFEFDEQGNKKILVDNKTAYNVDVNQKITFKIGENADISFNGGIAFISNNGGQIVCSMQRNRVVFSLDENTRKSDSLREDQRSSDVQQSLQDSLNNFVTDIKTNCENFEYSFLKSLE